MKKPSRNLSLTARRTLKYVSAMRNRLALTHEVLNDEPCVHYWLQKNLEPDWSDPWH
jgi:hypothetical protein